MKLGAYPFPSTGAIEKNLQHMERGVAAAKAAGISLLAFHECALCGYPPIETSIESIRPQAVEQALRRLGELAKSSGVNLLTGTVRHDGERRYNSAILIDKEGRRRDIYDKQAIWGRDADNFRRGEKPGIFELEGYRIGVRICFDVRFPEPFRALYRAGADACVILFSDTQPEPSPRRYEIIKGHIITRAVECLAPVLTVNSLSGCPTAPTAAFDRNGGTVAEAHGEELIICPLDRVPFTFGEEGRRVNNAAFMGETAN